MRERPSSPNCTHVDMDRVYGYDQRCCVCGSLSSIGFLYQCKQDNKPNSIVGLESQKTGKIGPVKSNLRKELERSGLSESVITGAESGHYTTQQLQKLKQLKRDLRHTIIDVEQADQANDAIARLMEMSLTPCKTGDDLDSLAIVDKAVSGCTFTACHACRPHYLDRLYISFQTAVTTEFPPMTQADIAKLPVKSAAIMRNMNTKGRRLSTKKVLNSSTATLTSASPKKTDPLERTFKITPSDIQQSILQRRPQKTPRHPTSQDPYRQTSLLRTQGFKTAVQGIFRYHRDTSPSPLTTAEILKPNKPTPQLDMTAIRLARREKMRKQLLKHETSLHGFTKPVKANTVSTFNVVHTETSIKTPSRLQIYSLDTDTDTDEDKEKDIDMDLSEARYAARVARMQSPNVVSIKRNEVGERVRKGDAGAPRVDAGRVGTKEGYGGGMAGIMTQV
ncbi:hypothetical protein yc1106_09080 [Curvularia clavata]|uniref:Uncharacterized protein n=1 Tax=Curvularia clavata TaxID=95742 RepID=A0A9Q8ZEG6_CURCL|nr:hypothetical protein yc1106_09080 [Curvularia clavata]